MIEVEYCVGVNELGEKQFVKHVIGEIVFDLKHSKRDPNPGLNRFMRDKKLKNRREKRF